MSNLVTIQALDSFHQSGYGVLHHGEKMKNFPEHLAKQLEKSGLVKIVTGKDAAGAKDAAAELPDDLKNDPNFVEDGGLKGKAPEDEEKKKDEPANKATPSAPENKSGGRSSRRNAGKTA